MLAIKALGKTTEKGGGNRIMLSQVHIHSFRIPILAAERKIQVTVS